MKIKKVVALVLILCVHMSLVKVVNAAEYEYDRLNRIIKVIYEEDGSYITYTYDANGNITKIRYYLADGSEVKDIIPKKDLPYDGGSSDKEEDKEAPGDSHGESGGGQPAEGNIPGTGEPSGKEPYVKQVSEVIIFINHYIEKVNEQFKYLEEISKESILSMRIPNNLPQQIKNELVSALENQKKIQEVNWKAGWVNSRQIKRLLGVN